MKTEREKLRSDKNALKRMLSKIEFTAVEVQEAASRSVVEFHKVSKSYIEDGREKIILDGFNLRILRGDRIGIVGKNGSGKTSFLKMLVGEIKPDKGTVKLARDLSFSYFDQKRKDLHPDHSLHRTLCPNGSDYIEVMGKDRHVYGYLKDFLFDPRMAPQPVSTLSGGQKNRLMLAKILANPGTLLILDEPTNDLDMDTLDMLEDILANYTGTLLVVSHDRDFLDQTVSKVLAFEGDGKVTGVIGGYQDYLEMRRKRSERDEEDHGSDDFLEQQETKKSGSTEQPPPPNRIQQKLTYKEQYELDNLPGKIALLEKEINDIEMALSDPDLYARDPGGFANYSKRIAAAIHERDVIERRWLELEEARQVLEQQSAKFL